MSDRTASESRFVSLAAGFPALVLTSVVLAASGVGLFAFPAARDALERERASSRAAIADATEALAIALLRAHADAAAQIGSSTVVRAAFAGLPATSGSPPPDGATATAGTPGTAEEIPLEGAPARPAYPPASAELRAMRAATPFDTIALARLDGAILAASTMDRDRLDALRRIARVTEGPKRSNLRRGRAGAARYDLAVPVRIGGRTAGFVLAEVRADEVQGALSDCARLVRSGEDRCGRDELQELATAEPAAVSETSSTDDGDSIDEAMRQAAFATLGLALVALAAAVALVRAQMVPLAALAMATRRMADGDLRQVPATMRRGDELGRLSSAITALHGGLRHVFGGLHEGIDSLAGHARAARASARAYADGAEVQSSAVASTSSSLIETKKSSAATASAARTVLDATEAAVAVGRRGLDRIDEGVEAMSAIEDRVRGIATEALELSQQSARIGQIVETVNDLSEQSNVLAVNASVEAAKAGDRGRGFAVVAEEVRRLAEQSKRATQQIRQILGEVQRAVESVVMAAEEGTKRSEDGRHAIGEIRTTVHELASALEQNAESARRISASAADQAAGIAQLSSALESIVDTGDAASREARAFAASAGALTDLGGQLEALVTRYRL